MRERYPKGETLRQLYGIDERAESKPVVQSACNKITFDTLALELEKFGLENASIYKSITAEKKPIVLEVPQTSLPKFIVETIFEHPIALEGGSFVLQEKSQLFSYLSVEHQKLISSYFLHNIMIVMERDDKFL
jgi:hypothetical protein